MKFLHLPAALSAAVLCVPCLYTSVSALEPDYPCFMVTQSGQVINLSESLCGPKKSAPAVYTSRERAFDKYKQQAALEEELRKGALRQIYSTSKENLPAVTSAYIPR